MHNNRICLYYTRVYKLYAGICYALSPAYQILVSTVPVQYRFRMLMLARQREFFATLTYCCQTEGPDCRVRSLYYFDSGKIISDWPDDIFIPLGYG